MFFFIVKDNNIWPCLHRIRFPATYRSASVPFQSECACLHKTVNMVVFFVKSNEKTDRKGRALTQMYRVVPITKRENYKFATFTCQPYVMKMWQNVLIIMKFRIKIKHRGVITLWTFWYIICLLFFYHISLTICPLTKFTLSFSWK